MLGVIIFVLVVAVLVWAANERQKQQKAQAAQDAHDGVKGRFAGVAYTATELIDGAARYPLPGLVARVEDAGQLSRRITATRIVATGVFALAWRKRQDDRSVFLTVEGPGVAVVREISVKRNPQAPLKARQFAAGLNAVVSALPAGGGQ